MWLLDCDMVYKKEQWHRKNIRMGIPKGSMYNDLGAQENQEISLASYRGVIRIKEHRHLFFRNMKPHLISAAKLIKTIAFFKLI